MRKNTSQIPKLTADVNKYDREEGKQMKGEAQTLSSKIMWLASNYMRKEHR